MSKNIRFNAFDMACGVHQSPGLWRHPEDQSYKYTDISHWVDFAKLLEKGLFDGIFFADSIGVYDVYGGNDQAALKEGVQLPSLDPIQVAVVMASVTKHLGFGVSAGTGYEHPFPFARRLSTLDHLSKGRIGWNVVTGYLPSAAKNFGETELMEHDTRYDHADEYMEVIYKLLEGSWEDDAVVRDVKEGIYTDPKKVHHIRHKGKYFSVPGIHISEPSIQRMPVIYQAGTSPRGSSFAATHAEAIFVAPPSKYLLREAVAKFRKQLVDAGRQADSAKVYALATIITAATDEEAQQKYEEYKSYTSAVGALVFNSGWTGIDLSQYELDDSIGAVESNAVQATLKNWQLADDKGDTWRIRDIAEWSGIGGAGPVIVGSGETVANKLQEIVAETDVDGFNLCYAIKPGSFEDVINYVVPVLQQRGVYPKEYTDGALRHKLFAKGPRLPENHLGASYRVGGQRSTIIADDK